MPWQVALIVTVVLVLGGLIVTIDGKEKQDEPVVSKDKVDEGASEHVRVAVNEVPTEIGPVGIPETLIVFGT